MTDVLVAVAGSGLAVVGSASVLSVRALPAYRARRRLAAQRRAVSGFPRLSAWRRAWWELELTLTPRGQLREVRALRLRIADALEQAGDSALVLARLDRVDGELMGLVGRLRDIGLRLDRRVALMMRLRDPRLLAGEISTAAVTTEQVERMSVSLATLAAAAAGGTIDLDAVALRRELEAEVYARLAGHRRYRELVESEAQQTASAVAGEPPHRFHQLG